jgi:hypothetical protein
MCADEPKNAAPEDPREPDLPTQPEPKPLDPGKPRMSTVREKAMAASTPGTEYWLT